MAFSIKLLKKAISPLFSLLLTSSKKTISEQQGKSLFTCVSLFSPIKVMVDDRLVTMQIWDTAGQERFRTITTAYYRGAMGIMLVYDITNEKSFDNIKNWIRNIEEHASADVEKMILGNKCDMNDRRQVG